MNKKRNIKIPILYIALILVVVFAASALISGMKAAEKLSYSEIIELFEKDEVKEFTVEESGKLTITKTDGTKISRVLLIFSVFREDIEPYLQNANLEKYDYKEPSQNSWLMSYLPYVLITVIMIVVAVIFMKKMNGGAGGAASFGKSRARLLDQDKKRVLFSDVAGADEEKEELREIVEFLKNPEKYRKLGARIPRGVLLQGPPGTGKTLLAKAVAGEAGVPFLSISGSDFVEMYVGVGASRVRDLFETAKKAPASIVFIDEIDAVGRHRGAGLGGGHDEREQTLNQLLVEMDGFGSHEGIIVIAATNRPDILDQIGRAHV